MEPSCNTGTIGRFDNTQVLDTVHRLKKLLIDCHLHVILEDITAEVLPGHGLQTCSWKTMDEVCDLVVVVDGDGGMPDAVRALTRHKAPVLRINRDSLGLPTDIRPDELEVKVNEVLDDQYIIGNHFPLDTRVRRGIDSMGQGDALNDIILHPGKSIWMIEFELYIDGQSICSQRADGLIVAASTGSIAYVSSVGSPIMYLKLGVIIIVSMYPHMFSSRPVVIDGNSELRIVVSPNVQIYPQVSCDGQNHFACAPGDVVTISKKPQELHLIHPIGHNYHEIYRIKPGWGSRLGGDD